MVHRVDLGPALPLPLEPGYDLPELHVGDQVLQTQLRLLAYRAQKTIRVSAFMALYDLLVNAVEAAREMAARSQSSLIEQVGAELAEQSRRVLGTLLRL